MMRRVCTPAARCAVTTGRRWIVERFVEAEKPPSQAELNRMREHMPEDMSWLPDAMWKNGRRATISEIYAADPYQKELAIDREMGRRKHPLHDGIKAAFEKRVQVLARRQAEAEAAQGIVDADVPEGLTELQRKVYIDLQKQDEERLGKISTYKQYTDEDSELRNRFAGTQTQMTSEDLRRYNFEGETDGTDIFDIFLQAVRGILYLFILYFMFTGAASFAFGYGLD